MAAPLITTVGNALRTTFADGFFNKAENEFVELTKEVATLKNYTALGKEKSFPFYLASPKNFRTGAEQTSTGTATVRKQINGLETPVELMGFFEISMLLRALGKVDGTTLNVDELKLQVREVTEDVVKYKQRMYTASHGTSAIGRVLSNVVADTAVPLAAPYFARTIMKNDKLQAYTADSAGSLVTDFDGAVVDFVDYDNRIAYMVTAVSCSADDWLYFLDSYGTDWNGLHGIIDDGTYQPLLHGQSRTTYRDLKAQVVDCANAALTENDIMLLLQRINNMGGKPTICSAGQGYAQAYLAIRNAQRLYSFGSGEGYVSRLAYSPEQLRIDTPWGSTIGFKVNHEIPPRNAFFYSPENLRVLKATPLGWVPGTDGNLHVKTTGTGGITTAHVGMIVNHENLIGLEPWRMGVIRNFKDAYGAGDTL